MGLRRLYPECAFQSCILSVQPADLHFIHSGGMIAPLLGGTLLTINRSTPVYTSVVVFAVAGICVLLLKEDAGDGGRDCRERVVVH